MRFIAFVKRSWPLVVGGIVLLVGMSVSLLMYAISGTGRKSVDVSAMSLPPSATTTTETLIARRLDGVMVPTSSAALPVLGVMVENAPDARPLSGPANANVVIEAPVEGGFTRFLLLFDASSTVDQIGPVRSARPYYVDWADALGAVYAHVGGSPEALEKMSHVTRLGNIDEMRYGNRFWRSAKRAAPHNAYTRSDLLTAWITDRAFSTKEFRPWRYLETHATSTSPVNSVDRVRIPYPGLFRVEWFYRTETNDYIRKQAGVKQADADGKEVATKNILVLLTDAQVLDDVGRLKLRTTGSGKGFLFRDGARFEIVWRRTAGNWISVETVDGMDAMFEPGTTWIEMVTDPGMLPDGVTTK